MKTRILLSLCALFISIIGIAQVPSTINFQGVLTDSNDDPIEGSFDMTFRIYNAEIDGTLMWEEVHSSVVVTKGLFNVMLGSVTAMGIEFNSSYYLSVQKGTESELSPRITLTSVTSSINSSYSMTSESTKSLSGVSNYVPSDGNVGVGYATSPLAKLAVSGKLYVRGDGDQGSGNTFTPTIDLSVDDSDTGLEVPSDGNLALYTNNVERMRLTSAGSVGIGTTAPNSLFHVNGPSTNDVMRVQLDGNTKFFMANTGKIAVAGFFDPFYDLDVSGSVAATSFPNTSDRRWKKNIKSYNDGLDKVLALRGVTFDWRTKEFPKQGFEEQGQIGFIAQEVEKVLPDLVTTNNEGYKSVKYSNITAVLVEAIKEQQVIIESLQNKLDKSEELQTQFSAELSELKTLMLKEIRKQNKKSLTASN